MTACVVYVNFIMFTRQSNNKLEQDTKMQDVHMSWAFFLETFKKRVYP